jgi:hypothetical protein
MALAVTTATNGKRCIFATAAVNALLDEGIFATAVNALVLIVISISVDCYDMLGARMAITIHCCWINGNCCSLCVSLFRWWTVNFSPNTNKYEGKSTLSDS